MIFILFFSVENKSLKKRQNNVLPAEKKMCLLPVHVDHYDTTRNPFVAPERMDWMSHRQKNSKTDKKCFEQKKFRQNYTIFRF